MKDSKLLILVKSKLREDRSNNPALGICTLISRHSTEHSQYASLVRWINSMLGSNDLFLDDWLLDKGHITAEEYEKMNDWRTTEEKVELLQKLRNTRLEWLDWMIDECREAEASK